MALIPVFKQQTREALIESWNLDFSISDWVSIKFSLQQAKAFDSELDTSLYEAGDQVEYEANRFNVTLFDPSENQSISVYLYMNEHLDRVLAIDSVVEDAEDGDLRYPLKETPFSDMLWELQSI